MQEFASRVIRRWGVIAPNRRRLVVNSSELRKVLESMRRVDVGCESVLQGFSSLVDHERRMGNSPQDSPVIAECVSLVALNHMR